LIQKCYSKKTSALKLEDVDFKGHGISMANIYTAILLVVRSSFLARPVTNRWTVETSRLYADAWYWVVFWFLGCC